MGGEWADGGGLSRGAGSFDAPPILLGTNSVTRGTQTEAIMLNPFYNGIKAKAIWSLADDLEGEIG